MRDNIILIGFMGCGKTSVGTRLAEKLSFSFLDTDEMLEMQEGKTISTLFAEKGEAFFRQRETKLLEELLEKTERTVISTGGGLPLRAENRELLQRLGFVVYLAATKETVLERLSGDTSRPLLNVPEKEARIEELLDFRQPVYEYTAHMRLSTDQKDFDEIMAAIIRNYEILMARQKEKKEKKEI